MRIALLAGSLLLATATAPPLAAQDVDPDQLTYVVDRCATLGTEEVQLCVDLAPAPPVIDVLFMMDLTASMGGELAALQSQIGSVMASIRGLASASSVEFGLISHEDYPATYSFCGYNDRVYSFSPDPIWPDESAYRVDAPIGSGDAAVIAAVGGMVLKRGFDAPESYARCLWEAGQPDSGITWRPGSVRLLVQFGDFLPHDCNLLEGIVSSPGIANTGIDPGRDALAGTADDIDWQNDAITAMQNANVKLISAFSGASFFFPAWQEWAEMTGGTAERLFGDGSVPDGRSLTQYLTDLVASVLSTVNTLQFIVDGACQLDITFDPSDTLGPIDISSGASVCVVERITVPQAIADDPTITSADCTVDVVADGALVGTQTIHVDLVDNVPPNIQCPASMNVGNDPGVCGAEVTLQPTADDNCAVDRIECTPASGSFFIIGTTPVSCTAYDVHGNQSAPCSFDVTVRDATEPTINCPSVINTVSEAGVCGATVNYGVTAVDDCSTPTVVCTPASGSFLPVGTTAVSCTATDGSGNAQRCGFDVNITDREAPTIACPSSTIVVQTDAGRCDAVVPGTYYAISADDNCGLDTVVCAPAAGSIFPIGTTQVNCVATDIHGNTNQCSFDVRVEDNQAPTVICPEVTEFIWPPLHQMEEVAIIYQDNCDTSHDLSYAIQVLSDEHASLYTGSGGQIHCPDAIIGEGGVVQVRAERAGGADGRVYIVNYTVTDRGGNPTSGSCALGVPHDSGGLITPIQSPVLYDAIECEEGAPIQPIVEEDPLDPLSGGGTR